MKSGRGFAFPPADELPQVEEMPDPFMMADGSRLSKREDWHVQREYIKRILLHYEYGNVPKPPGEIKAEEVSRREVLQGEAMEEILKLCFGPGEVLKVTMSLVRPRGEGPYPVIIKNDREVGQVPITPEIIDRDYIVVEYVRHNLDNDDADRRDGVHPLYPDCSWGTLAAWAWGAMRVIDYIAPLDYVDQDKIAFTGHSRGGKTALLAAALDERIAIAAPNGSGTGGAGSYRVQGEGAETLKDILTNFPYWFHSRLREFVGKENRMPFDQHFLRSAVAPRAVISTDALGDHWANPLGTQEVYRASQVIYDWLGAGEMNAIHFREGGHQHAPQDWRALLDFADFVFRGEDLENPEDYRQLPFETHETFSWEEP